MGIRARLGSSECPTAYKGMSTAEAHAHNRVCEERADLAAAMIAEQNAASRMLANLERNDQIIESEVSASEAEAREQHAYSEVERILSGMIDRQEPETLSGLITAAPEYPEFQAAVEKARSGGTAEVNFSGITTGQFLNTAFSTGAGHPPQIIRSGRIVLDEQRPPQLLDYIPQYPAMNGGYAYMQESNITSAVALVAEGATIPEATLALTEVSVKLQKLGHIIPVTEEQLEDVAGVLAYLNQRMAFLVRQKLDNDCTVGATGASKITGFRNSTGVNTTAKTSAIKLLDVYLNAANAVAEDVFMYPNLTVMNYAECKRLLEYKDKENRYLWGDPSMPLRMKTLWGMVIGVAPVAANEALTLQTMDKGLLTGGGVEVRIGENDDDFARHRRSVRCTVRANTLDFRPLSTCRITALNVADA